MYMNLGQNLLLWLRGTMPYCVSPSAMCGQHLGQDGQWGKGTRKGEAIMISHSRDWIQPQLITTFNYKIEVSTKINNR